MFIKYFLLGIQHNLSEVRTISCIYVVKCHGILRKVIMNQPEIWELLDHYFISIVCRMHGLLILKEYFYWRRKNGFNL